MRFGSTSVRKWAKEWRESDWRETIPLASGRECPWPGCRATICGGKSWREHWAGHDRADARLEEMHRQLVALSEAVMHLAIQAGHADWYPGFGSEAVELDEYEGDEPAALDGYVIGSGQLPAETRGGEG